MHPPGERGHLARADVRARLLEVDVAMRLHLVAAAAQAGERATHGRRVADLRQRRQLPQDVVGVGRGILRRRARFFAQRVVVEDGGAALQQLGDLGGRALVQRGGHVRLADVVTVADESLDVVVAQQHLFEARGRLLYRTKTLAL